MLLVPPDFARIKGKGRKREKGPFHYKQAHHISNIKSNIKLCLLKYYLESNLIYKCHSVAIL